jgi:hypothetical protein
MPGKKCYKDVKLTGGDALDIGFDVLGIVPVTLIAGKISKPLGKTIQKFGSTGKTISQKLDRKKPPQFDLKQGQKTKLPQKSDSLSVVIQKAQQFFKQLNYKANNLVSYDVTKFIRFLHQKAGRRGRNTMRFLGMEARIFMRQDAKVVMNPNQGLSGHFFRETLKKALNDVIGERAGYTVTVLEVAPKAIEISMSRRTARLLAKSKKKVTAWQQNISAWWLMLMKPVIL